eukprot:jgi/Mesvir1/17525/Mv08779-RA.1
MGKSLSERKGVALRGRTNLITNYFTRDPQSSDRLTLDHLMAIPGIGAQLMATFSIPNRVRLRRACHSFLAAADESLQGVTELFGEDVAGAGCSPGKKGLAWLLRKCPNLTTICVASRADHEEPWQERDRWALAWPTTRHYRIMAGVVPLHQIARRFQGLKHLNVAGCLDVTDAALIAVARACKGLEALDVSMTMIGDPAIHAVAKSCRGLRHLAIHNCMGLNNGTMLVAEMCGQLEVLYADGIILGDRCAELLACNCPRLRRLTVSQFLTDAGVSQVAACCPLLEHLGVQDCKLVTSASMKRIAAGCPRLQRLDASTSGVTDDGICELARCCRGLRRLDVAATAVSDVSVLAVANHCPQLEYLDVAQCNEVTDASIVELARNCKWLRHLSIAKCTLVTDAGICQVAQSCPGLRHLSIRQVGRTSACIDAIAANCRELRYFDMAGCRSGGMSVATLAEGCSKLEHLDVSWLYIVTQQGLAAVVQHCTQLRIFEATDNVLGNRNLAWLIKELGPRLRVLDLSYNLVTDATIELVARHCSGLRELTLRGCRDVTDKSMKSLMRGCVDLRRLVLEGCRVTTDGIEALDDGRCSIYWDDNPVLIR